jgi:DNA-binding XRE family transcriptional regulator
MHQGPMLLLSIPQECCAKSSSPLVNCPSRTMTRDDRRFLSDMGFRIRERRQELSLSQADLGDRSGLHRTYIGAVERGERNVSILNLRQIAKSLRTPLATLLEGPPAPQ